MALSILFRRGDTFDPWDYFQAVGAGGKVHMNGTQDKPTLMGDYGTGPRPMFKGDGTTSCFRNNGGFHNVTFRNLAAKHTGSFLSGLTSGKNIKVIGCDLEAAGISLQASPGQSVDSVDIIDTAIYNCLSSGPHRSGLFLHYAKNVTLRNVRLYRNGWHGVIAWDGDALTTTPDTELRGSIFNHGAYIQYTCGPIRCEGVVSMFNAGAGLQMRSGGDLIDSYISHNGETGVVWGGEHVDDPTNELARGEITGNVIVNHHAGGLIVNGSANVHVHGNLLPNATNDLGGGVVSEPTQNKSLVVVSTTGETAKGDIFFGMNDATIENNRISEIQANGSGWAKMLDYFPDEPAPAFGAKFIANKVSGEFRTFRDFADPNGQYIIADRASQEGQSFDWTLPDRLDNEAGIIDGTVDSQAIIAQTRGAGEVVSIHVANDGDDSAAGSIDSPVQTTIRALEIAGARYRQNVNNITHILRKAGDVFPAMGVAGSTTPNKKFTLSGRDGTPAIIGSYGEGRAFVEGGGTDVELIASVNVPGAGSSFVVVRDLHVTGGDILKSRTDGQDIALINCVGDNASVVVQAPKGYRTTGFVMRDCVIKNLRSIIATKQSGIYIARTDGVDIQRCTFDGCGWTGSNTAVETDLVANKYNHGAYLASSCGPVVFSHNVLTFNAGTGAQIRPGGEVRNNFIAWNAAPGVNLCSMLGSASGSEPKKSVTFTGNLSFSRGSYSADLGDVVSATIEGNTLVGARGALRMIAAAGENHHGGLWFGINDTTVSGNTLKGSVTLDYSGWGHLGGDGATVEGNDWDGDYEDRNTYADPLGKMIRGANNQVDLSLLSEPERTASLVEEIQNGITSDELIIRYKEDS